MATKKSQRIAIGVIAVVLIIGTIGSFAILIFANNGSSPEAIRQEQTTAQYQKQYEEYQKQQAEQATKLSSQYYDQFKGYESEVSTFDAGGVTERTTRDLKEGDGATVTDTTIYNAYYIGWRPDGKVFDSSIKEGSLASPISNSQGLIEGWTKGVVGMKVGGVREITMPASQAYGERGSGEAIPPNTPLKFIVMIVSTGA